MPKASDTQFFRRALELARRGEGHTRPNPPVGAVIVRNGRIVGEGWHKRAGTDHAEVAAIRNARGCLTGATIYVTLEPCSKPGRVGACTDAIVAAGITRVVYGAVDPNPTNRGRAKRVLAHRGVSCARVADREIRRDCEELIAAFSKHVRTGLPYVTVKLAMSLDGKICDDRGDAKWISSEKSRTFTGDLRAVCDAIMVGAETIRRDDPSLLCHSRRNDDLLRVVVTKSGRLPKDAQIFTDGRNPVKVFRVGSGSDRVGSGSDRVELGSRSSFCADDTFDAKDLNDPSDAKNPNDAKGSIDPKDPKDAKDLKDVLRQLGKAGVMHVLCEGGLKLARSLAEAGLVDRWLAVVAPVVIGSRRISSARRGRIAELASAVRFGDGFLTVNFDDV